MHNCGLTRSMVPDVVAGDVDPEEVFAAMAEVFADFPARPVQIDVSPAEPPQTAFRFKELPGDVNRVYGKLGFHIPAELHAKLPAPSRRTRYFSNGAWHRAQVFTREQLKPGNVVKGPAIVIELHQTIVVEPGWQATLNGQPAPAIGEFNADQRFFLGFAQAWRGKIRDEALRNQVLTDPHSPSQYRCNGTVRNMEPWYAAFNVQQGQALYLAPADRVLIW